MNFMPENPVKQRGRAPRVVNRSPYVHVGCTCLDCEEMTWLTLAIRVVLTDPRERSWRCKHCGTVGKLGLGT